MIRRPIRVGYAYEPGRITYWSCKTFRTLKAARSWACLLNKQGLPGEWVVRS